MAGHAFILRMRKNCATQNLPAENDRFPPISNIGYESHKGNTAKPSPRVPTVHFPFFVPPLQVVERASGFALQQVCLRDVFNYSALPL